MSSPAPSSHFAGLLHLLDQLASTVLPSPSASASPSPSPSSGPSVPARRQRLYQQLFDHLGGKNGGAATAASSTNATAGGGEDGPATTPPTSSRSSSEEESAADIEYVVRALPTFYQQLLVDVQRTIFDANRPVEVVDADAEAQQARVQRDRESLLLSRAAVRSLGYFLHHPTFCAHFPLGSAHASGVDGGATIDGVMVLTSVLSATRDRQLACMICWVLAEQCLSSEVLVRYVDRCIDAFLAAFERCQAAAKSPATAAASCAPLLQEVMHALWKFARLAPDALRARCRSDRPHALDWLHVLVLRPFLNPVFYFDAKHQGDADVELKRLALSLLDVCVGTGTGPVPHGVDRDFLLREVTTQTTVFDFCTGCQRVIHGEGWVKQVAVVVQSRVLVLDNELRTRREAARDVAKESAKGGGAAESDLAASEYAASARAFTSEYESRMCVTFNEAFDLLATYLNAMGKLATVMIPAAAAVNSGTTATPPNAPAAAAINHFLAFYQPLFSHPLPAIRAMVFASAWRNVCRVLNMDDRAATAAPMLPPSHSNSSASLASSASRATATASASSAATAKMFNKKSMIPLSMKPFVHQLTKEKDPVVVGAILKTWIEVVAENFLTRTPSPDDSATGSEVATAAHRLHQPVVYEECVGKVLKMLLAPKMSFESSGTYDSHMRARIYEEMLQGFLLASATAEGGGGQVDSPDDASTNSHDTRLDASTSVHTSSTAITNGSNTSSTTAPQAPPSPPALSRLPRILTALLAQPSSSPTRVTFLQSLTHLLAKFTSRVAGLNEQKAWLALYQHLLELAVKESGTRRPVATSAHDHSADNDKDKPASLLHTLFDAWKISSDAIASMLNVTQAAASSTPPISPSAAAAAQPPIALSMLTERQSLRLHFALVMQLNTLKAWLNVRVGIESRSIGALFTDRGVIDDARPNFTSVDAAYNATPTPTSAGNHAHSPPPPPTGVLVCLFVRWVAICAPLLNGVALQVLSLGAQDKVRELFVDGVRTLLAHYFASLPPSSIFDRASSGLRFMIDLAARLSRANNHKLLMPPTAWWLIWILVVKTQTRLLQELVPLADDDGADDASAAMSPIRDASSASVDGASLALSSAATGVQAVTDRLAHSLSQAILHHEASHALTAHGHFVGQQAITPEVKENATEAVLYTLSLAMQQTASVTSLDSHDATDASPTNEVDWVTSFHSCAHRVIRCAVFTAVDSDASHPDLLSLLVPSLVDAHQLLLTAAAADAGVNATKATSLLSRTLLIRTVSTLLDELQPTITTDTRLSSHAAAAASNWKQWKTHPDASVHKFVCAIVEAELKAVRPSSSSSSSSSSVVELPPTVLLPLLTSLARLFERCPHSASCIDAIALFFRTMPAMHALLAAIDARTTDAETVPLAATTTTATAAAVIQLWTSALTAFRKNYHGEFDFHLLQTAGGKVIQVNNNHNNSLGGDSGDDHEKDTAAARSTPPKSSLLFVDVLTTGLRHALKPVRDAAVQYWTLTYAARPSHTRPAPTSVLRFSHHPDLVAACQALVTAGEMKVQQMPLVVAPPPLAASGASLPGTPAPMTPAAPSTSPSPSSHGADADMHEAEMMVDVDEEMNLTDLLHETSHVSTTTDTGAAPAPRSEPSPHTPHTPLCTAHSFLPQHRFGKKPGVNLLDRLAGMSAHAFPPEAPVMAPSTTTTVAPAVSRMASATSVASTTEEQESTLSPFPPTPAATAPPSAAGGAAPQEAPGAAASTTTNTIVDSNQRATSVLVPRTLFGDFDAAAAAAAQPLVVPADEPPAESQMALPTPSAPVSATVSSTAGTLAPPATSPHPDSISASSSMQRTASIGAPAAAVPEVAAAVASDDLDQSLSMPLGSSISQLQAPVPMEDAQEPVEDDDDKKHDEVAPRAIDAAANAPSARVPFTPATDRRPVHSVSLPLLPLDAQVPAAPSTLLVSFSQPAMSVPAANAPSTTAAQTEVERTLSVPSVPASTTPVEANSMSKSNSTEAPSSKEDVRAMPTPPPATVEEEESKQLDADEPPIDVAATTVATNTNPIDARTTSLPLPVFIAPTTSPESDLAPAPPLAVPAPVLPSSLPPPPPAPSSPPPSRPRSASSSRHSTPSKRVMFNERQNVEISPSPNFSAGTASLEPMPDAANAHEKDNAAAAQPTHVEHTAATTTEPLPAFTFSPVTQGELDAHAHEERKESYAPSSDAATAAAADRRSLRAEQRLAHDAKKAQLKLQANPPTTVTIFTNDIVLGAAVTAGPPPSILKSPEKSRALKKSARALEEEEAAAASNAPLFPSLASSLVSLAHLRDFFPPGLATHFADLFSLHHLVTIGDVATRSTASLTTSVPIAIRLHVAQESHAGGTVTVAQLIRDALDQYARSRRQTPTASAPKKRKHGDDDDAAVVVDPPHPDAAPSVTPKRAKLVGTSGSLQTTQQQEAWLERTVFHSADGTANETNGSSATPSIAVGVSVAPAQAPLRASTSASQSQLLSCSDVANASPVTPFVAPELTSVPRAPLPVVAPTSAAVVAVEQQPSRTVDPAPPMDIDHGHQQATPPPDSDARSPHEANTTTITTVYVDPAAHQLELAKEDRRPVLSVVPPTATPQSTAVPAAPALPLTASCPPPAAPATTGVHVMPVVDVDAPPAFYDDLDAASEMEDVCEAEPMMTQMDEMRFHLRSAMATLFASSLSAPVANAAVPAAAAAMSMPPLAADRHAIMVHQLTLPQLQELHSCMHSMQSAVQQQLSKLQRHDRRSHTPSKMHTPTRTNSRTGASPAGSGSRG